MSNQNEIVIYRPNAKLQLQVRLENETIWLTQSQIADLFAVQRPAITKHLGNIFASHELEESSVSSILEHTAQDGKTYYNPPRTNHKSPITNHQSQISTVFPCFPDGRPTVEKDLAKAYYHLLPTFTRIAPAV